MQLDELDQKIADAFEYRMAHLRENILSSLILSVEYSQVDYNNEVFNEANYSWLRFGSLGFNIHVHGDYQDVIERVDIMLETERKAFYSFVSAYSGASWTPIPG